LRVCLVWFHVSTEVNFVWLWQANVLCPSHHRSQLRVVPSSQT